MTETHLEMWWPSPEAFEDLGVNDIETGWELTAPDDTELGAWLAFWNQDEAHRKVFNDAFLSVITTHALDTLKEHGKAEDLPDGGQGNPEQTQDERSGMLSQHEPGCNSDPSP